MKLSLLSTISAICGLVLLVHAARVLRRNDDRALDLAVAHVFPRRLLVVVVDGDEGAHVGAHGIERLADLERLRAAVLIDHAEPRVAILPPKALPSTINCTSGKIIDASISAGERKNLRISRSTIAIIRFMVAIPGRCGMVKPYAFTSSSRNWRPV